MQIKGTDIENQVSKVLVEHLNIKPAFASWFWQQVNSQRRKLPPFTKGRAEYSPSRKHVCGQTDFALDSSTDCAVILAENKIMHKLSKDQRDRYKQERDGLIANGCTAAIALIAPKRYLHTVSSAADDFDACITYEAINDHLGGDPLILKGIKRCDEGYLARGVAAVICNFEGYHEIVRRDFPKLRAITPADNTPTQSRTIQFDSSFAEGQPLGVPYVRLLHQWQEGRAKLLFRGWGTIREQLAAMISADVAGDGYYLDPNPSKSLGFMKPTPVIDNHAPFKSNEDAFIEGLQVVEELFDWYLSHVNVVKKWVTVASRLTDV